VSVVETCHSNHPVTFTTMETNHLSILTSQLYLRVSILPCQLMNQILRAGPVVSTTDLSNLHFHLPTLFNGSGSGTPYRLPMQLEHYVRGTINTGDEVAMYIKLMDSSEP
jgi:hypothetical protein